MSIDSSSEGVEFVIDERSPLGLLRTDVKRDGGSVEKIVLAVKKAEELKKAPRLEEKFGKDARVSR